MNVSVSEGNTCCGQEQGGIGSLGLKGVGCSLNDVTRVGFIEEVMFESGLEGGDDVGHANICREKELSGQRPGQGSLCPAGQHGWSQVSPVRGDTTPARKAGRGESQVTWTWSAHGRTLSFLYHYTSALALLDSSRHHKQVLRTSYTYYHTQLSQIPRTAGHL